MTELNRAGDWVSYEVTAAPGKDIRGEVDGLIKREQWASAGVPQRKGTAGGCVCGVNSGLIYDACFMDSLEEGGGCDPTLTHCVGLVDLHVANQRV